MSRVADGATTRRERILDMLRYIRTFMPKGVGITQVQTYMSLAHGLTFKTSQKYVYEMQMAGLVEFESGMLKIDIPQFERLMQLLGRGFDITENIDVR